MTLTVKQENFCREVAEGKTFVDAYLSAYDWKGNKAGAMVEATKLMNREEIQNKVKALLQPKEIAIQKDNINARDAQIEAIKERIRICEQKEDETSLIRYYDMLNKIYALYKDTEEPAKKETNVINLSTEALKKLAE